MRSTKLLALLLFVCLSPLSLAQIATAAPVLITPEFTSVNIADYCEALIDPDGEKTVGDVSSESASKSWRSCEEVVLSRGNSHEALWVRFSVENSSSLARTLYLEETVPFIRDIRVFQEKGDGKFTERRYGAGLKFSDRWSKLPNFFIPLSIPSSGKAIVYCRFQTAATLLVALSLHSQSEFEKRGAFALTYNGVLIGGITLLMLFNLFLYLVLRDRNYLNYVFYSLSVLIMCGNIYGYNLQFFWPDWPDFNFMVGAASPALGGMFLLIFVRRFLNTSSTIPWATPLIIAFIVLQFAGACLQFTGSYQNELTNINKLTGSLTAVFVLILGLYAWVRKVPGSIYFLIAWIPSLTGFIGIGLMANGIIDFSFFAYYYVGAGVMLEMSLLSFALASRINILQKEKENASAQALNAERIMTHLLKRSKDELEEKVKERTSELEEAKRYAEEIAMTDMLTELNNRRAFFDVGAVLFSNAIRYQHLFSLIMIDLDKFKNINDTYGHTVGDEVIKAMANALRNIVRESDIVGRLGGEEFAVILPETDLDSAGKLAERLRIEVLKQKVDTGGASITFTSSFGVAQLGDDCRSLDALIAKADVALYDAKESGRNKVSFASA